MYVSTKNYGPEAGFAVAYRQWRAESHCRLIHGYAMGFYFEFESETIDFRNWCVDYGSLKSLKNELVNWFDHCLLVAEDDPEFATFKDLHERGLCKMTVVEKTGCEGLSKWLYDYVNEIWLPDNGYNHVHCRMVKVTETPSNAAWFECNSAEHDAQILESLTNQYRNVDQFKSYADVLTSVKEVRDCVKRIKLAKNKKSAQLDFEFFCKKAMMYASTDVEVAELTLLSKTFN